MGLLDVMRSISSYSVVQYGMKSSSENNGISYNYMITAESNVKIVIGFVVVVVFFFYLFVSRIIREVPCPVRT